MRSIAFFVFGQGIASLVWPGTLHPSGLVSQKAGLAVVIQHTCSETAVCHASPRKSQWVLLPFPCTTIISGAWLDAFILYKGINK